MIILGVLIRCLLIAASLQKGFMILFDKYALYSQEMKLASLPESSKVKTYSLLLLNWIF